MLGVSVADPNFTPGQRLQSEDRAQERAFARTVAPEDRGGTSAGNIEGEIAQRAGPTIKDGNVAETHDVVRCIGHGLGSL